jgi:anti-sigma regulatory factor (Ser/Thr protein kinase)
MGMTYLAQRRTLDPKVVDLLDRAMSSSRKLLSMINDLIDVSNIEANRLTLDCIHFCIDTLLNRVEKSAKDAALQKGFGLEFEVSSDVRKRCVEGDLLRLGQILTHLVDNAFKFSQRGPVTLRVQIIEEKPAELTLLFEVEDKGIGIAPEDHNRVFSTFEQGDGSSTRQFGGIGLGLTLSKRLVKQMGGSIGVKSQPGAGSCFWFTARLGLTAEVADTAGNSPQSANSLVNASDCGRLQSVCHKLLAMMDAGAWDVLALLKHDADLFRQVSPEELQRMNSAVERFDFDEAASALKVIMQMLDNNNQQQSCPVKTQLELQH